jgi:M6 family metalloprotease-like protein
MKKILLFIVLFFIYFLIINLQETYAKNETFIEGYLNVIVSNKKEYYLSLNDGRFLRVETKLDLKGISYIKAKGFLNNDVFIINQIIEQAPSSYPKFITPLKHPAIGEQKVLVIRVEFPNIKFKKTDDEIREILNKMDKYYREVSFNLTYLNFSIYNDIVSMDMPSTYYGSPCGSYVDCYRAEFISEIINKVDNYVNFNLYERILIIHAGRDEAITNNNSDIWSFSSIGEWAIKTNDGKVYVSISVVSQYDFFGIYVHEFGHALGLPDLYMYGTFESRMGVWDLMDIGYLNGDILGSSPAHPNALLKYFLGWIKDEQVLNVNLETIVKEEVKFHELLNKGYYLIRIKITDTNYYVVESRTKVGFDSFLPNEGVLIYYVDETKDSGEGPFRLIDSRPLTSTLNDAYFRVDEKFVDNNLSINIIRKSKEGFLVGVYYSSKRYDVQLSTKESRISFDSYANITAQVKDYLGNPVQNITVILNNSLYSTTNNKGISYFLVKGIKLGEEYYTVTDLKYNEVSVLFNSLPIKIIWDGIEVYDISPLKGRFNLGSQVLVKFKLRYYYDKSEFNGIVKVNGIQAKYEYGYYWVTIMSPEIPSKVNLSFNVVDNKYNINYVLVEKEPELIWDRLIVEKPEVVVVDHKQEYAEVKIVVKSEYDNKILKDAIVKVKFKDKIQNLLFYSDSYILRVENPGNITLLKYEIIEITWGNINVTKHFNKTISVIFNKLIVLKYETENERYEVNSKARIYLDIVYAFEYYYGVLKSLEKNSLVIVNGLEAKFDSEKGKFYIELTLNKIGKVYVKVEKIISATNITSFEDKENGKTIIFDKIIHEIYIENYPFKTKYIVKVFYASDNSFVRNAKIFINNNQLKESEGFYYIEIDDYFIYNNVDYKIMVNGFNLIEGKSDNLHLVNLFTYLMIIISFIILFLILRFKKMKYE